MKDYSKERGAGWQERAPGEVTQAQRRYQSYKCALILCSDDMTTSTSAGSENWRTRGFPG